MKNELSIKEEKPKESKNSKKTKDEDSLDKGYTIRMKQSTLQAVDMLIVLKNAEEEEKVYRNHWILESFEEKLERDLSKPSDPEDTVRSIFIKISQKMLKKIDACIDKRRVEYGKASKSIWMLDAIREKLNKDLPELKNASRPLKQAVSKASKPPLGELDEFLVTQNESKE